MKSEMALRNEAMNILVKKLGLFDAERFIATIKKDKFDYTEWRRDLYSNQTIEEIYSKAAELSKLKKKQK